LFKIEKESIKKKIDKTSGKSVISFFYLINHVNELKKIESVVFKSN